MIEKLINYLQCIPMEDKNKFGKHIEWSDDIKPWPCILVTIDESGNYYMIDIELEEVHCEICVGEGEYEKSVDTYKRIECVGGVSYWNWEDNECLKVLDTTRDQLTEILTYLPNGEI